MEALNSSQGHSSIVDSCSNFSLPKLETLCSAAPLLSLVRFLKKLESMASGGSLLLQ